MAWKKDRLKPRHQRSLDPGFVGIHLLVAGVVVWLLLTPWMPAVSGATMRRFHLATGSFAGWAAQFPIPAMYNFANRSWYDGSTEPGETFYDGERHLNHFPARAATFADARYFQLWGDQSRRMDLRSSYRGRTLASTYRLERTGPRGYRWDRQGDATRWVDE